MDQFDFGQEARRLRVGTLVRLRWIAAAGQIAALGVASLALHIAFPLGPAALCIAFLLAFNTFLRLRFSPAKRLDERTTTYILAVDIAQLAALLYLTGGIANPFAMLLLAPTMISAVSQTWVETCKLLALAIACALAVTLWRVPLQLPDGALYDPPGIEKGGFLLAIVVSAVFVVAYGGQVAKEARQLAGALAATEMILARAQHLSQLDGLAAAAAHEFGTPLATLTVIVHELAAQREVAALCGEDLALAAQELSRCRAILGRLSTANRLASEPFDEVELEALLEQVAAPHRLQDVDIVTRASGPEPRPRCAGNPALLYGLRNLAENAVAFARTQVVIAASWGSDRIEISIEDDGPGFPANVLQRLGEPYISDRTTARHSEPEAGLGLGLFIAKALLERIGAELRIDNPPLPGQGARAVVSWPRGLFERTATAAEKPSPISVIGA